MDTKTRPIVARHTGRWSQRQRLEFIDSRLQWERGINRRELVTRFGVSLQQASADLNAYSSLAPGNLEYDRNAKLYRSGPRFVAAFQQPEAADYLNALVDPGTKQLGHVDEGPPLEVVRVPVRSIRTDHLVRVLQAIRDRMDVKIVYQSLRRPEPSARWVAPHALGSDGQRWHMRAWCHETSEFRDFVLSRILRVETTRASAVDTTLDHWWTEMVRIVIEPSARLTIAQRNAIELDFNMKNGRFVIECRKAMAFYYLRQLQLVNTPDTPRAHPIELANRAELDDVIQAGTNSSDRNARSN